MRIIQRNMNVVNNLVLALEPRKTTKNKFFYILKTLGLTFLFNVNHPEVFT